MATTIAINRKSNFAQPEVLIPCFLLFSLFYYSYNYFFPFDNGTVGAPTAIVLIKDLVYAIFIIVLAFAVRPRVASWQQFLFVPFALALLITTALHITHTPFLGQIGQNIKNLLIYIPMFMLMFNLNETQYERLSESVFTVLLAAATIQCVWAIIYDAAGGRLWDDPFFTGFLTNPNSFALMLNMALAVVLVLIRRSTLRWTLVLLAMVALLSYVILRTVSGSEFAIMLLLFPYAVLLSRRAWTRYLAVGAVLAAVIFSSQLSLESTVYTVSNVGSTINLGTVFGTNDPAGEFHEGPKPQVSTSVTSRLNNIKLALSVVTSGPMSAWLGDFKAKAFTPMDGQFWVFLYNNGLITLLAFSLAAAYIYVSTLIYSWKHPEDEPMLMFHLIIMIFGITCIASRILMYFPFNFIFFVVCGLAMSRLRMIATSERQKAPSSPGALASPS